MANKVLNSLLKEYEQKRIKAEMELDIRKEKLYKKIPRLNQIEIELNNFAIQTSKNILNGRKYSLENFNEKVENLKKEKRDILKENKLDETYLKPKYSCNICNDTGYILKDNYQTVMCNCLKQKLLDVSYNKSNMTNLNKENFNNFNLNMFSDEVNEEKFKSKISPRKNMEYIYKQSKEFIENFDNPEFKNLLFTGNTGLRKNIYVKLYSK